MKHLLQAETKISTDPTEDSLPLTRFQAVKGSAQINTPLGHMVTDGSGEVLSIFAIQPSTLCPGNLFGLLLFCICLRAYSINARIYIVKHTLQYASNGLCKYLKGTELGPELMVSLAHS